MIEKNQSFKNLRIMNRQISLSSANKTSALQVVKSNAKVKEVEISKDGTFYVEIAATTLPKFTKKEIDQIMAKWSPVMEKMKTELQNTFFCHDFSIIFNGQFAFIDGILEPIEKNAESSAKKVEPVKGNEKGKKATTEVKKDETAPKKAEPKNAADSDKKPGVIASIAEMISKGKKISKSQILENLVNLFPERESESMKQTITVQLGSEKTEQCRMAKEKGWVIECTKKDDDLFFIKK